MAALSSPRWTDFGTDKRNWNIIHVLKECTNRSIVHQVAIFRNSVYSYTNHNKNRNEAGKAYFPATNHDLAEHFLHFIHIYLNGRTRLKHKKWR